MTAAAPNPFAEAGARVVGRGGEAPPELTECPRGPLLVRGASAVLDQGGTPHPATRAVVAVCVCGKTQREPWCDGTHKVLRP